ncbi:MOB kinase activator 1B [Pteropus vampyrus]|uniref:MOB kinase activator 1B n=1 Tax=Pteropus vampyrus TaxID=132908 RepID=A0A6P6CH66_PTEVA|nr:MOB kinase activator 1B [Pteropus vampyrus]
MKGWEWTLKESFGHCTTICFITLSHSGSGKGKRCWERIWCLMHYLIKVKKSFNTLVGSRSSKTFKPKKNIPEGSHQYELLKHAEATLGSGNLRMAVMLPEGEDLNEWVAVNSFAAHIDSVVTIHLCSCSSKAIIDNMYSNGHDCVLIKLQEQQIVDIRLLYSYIFSCIVSKNKDTFLHNQHTNLQHHFLQFIDTISIAAAVPRYEYHWADGTNIKKPIKCSAPKYIDYLMTWVQDQLDDETLFPSKIGVPFPKNFMSVAKTILKRLFRVYAHIYHQHFDPVIQLQEEAHLNTSFKHFIFFVQEFNLIDRRELAPLQELIEKLTSKDR